MRPLQRSHRHIRVNEGRLPQPPVASISNTSGGAVPSSIPPFHVLGGSYKHNGYRIVEAHPMGRMRTHPKGITRNIAEIERALMTAALAGPMGARGADYYGAYPNHGAYPPMARERGERVAMTARPGPRAQRHQRHTAGTEGRPSQREVRASGRQGREALYAELESRGVREASVRKSRGGRSNKFEVIRQAGGGATAR